MTGRKLTIADVAKRAGVSTGLVSFALNGKPGVAPETRERILAIASDMGWQPDMRARALSKGRALAYGLVIHRDPAVLSADSFFPTFISGVERAISQRGHVLVLSVVDSAEQEIETYRTLTETGRVDGVFLTDVRRNDPRLALMESLRTQVVVVGYPDTDATMPVVSVADDHAAQELVAHLHALNHTDLALVMGPEHLLHASRWRDLILSAMQTRGMRVPRIVQTDFSAESGLIATKELLDSGDRPTAILYANDQMALAGLGYARRSGIDVPSELSISGWGDSDLTRYAFPSLTTVAVDSAEWGFRAATALMRAVAGAPQAPDVARQSILTIRESTALAPTAGVRS
jgi:DNA-binding LacI/PurR family transcriptional regulator